MKQRKKKYSPDKAAQTDRQTEGKIETGRQFLVLFLSVLPRLIELSDPGEGEREKKEKEEKVLVEGKTMGALSVH